MENRCVKCGAWLPISIKKLLRCDKCRREVDKEFNHEQNKPFDFYFEYYNKWKQLMSFKKKTNG